jgi:Secretion system C-terminal sorting domain
MKTDTYKLTGLMILMLSASTLFAQVTENRTDNSTPAGTTQGIDDISRQIDPQTATDIPFAVFPNPANCVLYVRMGTDPAVQSELKIFNALYQQIYSRNVTGISDLTVDITGYAEGMYYVRLSTGKNEIQVKKIQIVP